MAIYETDSLTVTPAARNGFEGVILPANLRDALAPIDQVVFAGGNFLLAVCLARWLSEYSYGVFATAYSVLLLFSAVHASFLLEPLSVLGAGKYAHAFRAYMRVTVKAHVAFSSFVIVLVVPPSVWLSSQIESEGLARTLAIVAIITPFFLLLQLMRRAFYARLKPGSALVTSCIYSFGLLAAVYLLTLYDNATSVSVFVAIGSVSLLASVVALPFLVRSTSKCPSPACDRRMWSESWVYGRIAVMTALLMWLTSHSYYIALAILSDLTEAARFRAILNLVAPFQHILIGVSGILLPRLSINMMTDRQTGNYVMMKYLRLLMAIGIIYAVALLLFGDPVVRFVYNGRYIPTNFELTMLALAPLVWTGFSVFANGLRANNQPSKVLCASAISGAALAIVGLPVIAALGSTGAIVSLLLTSTIGACLLAERYRHLYRTFSGCATPGA